MHRASSPSAPASRSRPKKRRSDGHNSGLHINSLPLDLLKLILQYTPLRARLRTLSFVCKRWRTASLESVLRLSLSFSGMVDESEYEEDAAKAVQLFPSFTSFRLHSCDLFHIPLPSTLRALSVLLRGEIPTEGVEDERSSRTFFSEHFPELCSFSFDCLEGYAEQAAPLGKLFVGFLSRHLSTLTILKLKNVPVCCDADDIITQLAECGMPLVEKLVLPILRHSRTVVAAIQSAPRLLSLAVTLEGSEGNSAFFALPKSLLTSLERLCLADSPRLSDEQVTRLRQLPSLRILSGLIAVPEPLRHLQLAVSLEKDDAWSVLAQCPHVRSVTLPQDWSGQVTRVPLLHLHMIELEAPQARCFALATDIVRLYRGLQLLSLAVAGDQDERLGKQIEELCEEGVRCGLQELRVRYVVAKCPPPLVAKLGWIHLNVYASDTEEDQDLDKIDEPLQEHDDEDAEF